jgi:hypothetical protein
MASQSECLPNENQPTKRQSSLNRSCQYQLRRFLYRSSCDVLISKEES